MRLNAWSLYWKPITSVGTPAAATAVTAASTVDLETVSSPSDTITMRRSVMPCSADRPTGTASNNDVSPLACNWFSAPATALRSVVGASTSEGCDENATRPTCTSAGRLDT